MTVTLSSHGVVELSGACPVEDAEILLQYLLAAPHAPVDWSACESAHSAVIQVLLVAKASPQGSPHSLFLKDHVGPLLAPQGKRAPSF
jgi:hypothetical protein